MENFTKKSFLFFVLLFVSSWAWGQAQGDLFKFENTSKALAGSYYAYTIDLKNNTLLSEKSFDYEGWEDKYPIKGFKKYQEGDSTVILFTIDDRLHLYDYCKITPTRVELGNQNTQKKSTLGNFNRNDFNALVKAIEAKKE